MKGGRVKIDAHGTFGEGTSEFTLSLANDLGEIIERHAGKHHVHNEVETKQEVKQYV
jgi:hypothetical protein